MVVREVPTVCIAELRAEAGPEIMAQAVGEMLDGHYPALKINATPGCDINKPPVRTLEIGLIKSALANLGYEARSKQIWPIKEHGSRPMFGPVNPKADADLSWHIDNGGIDLGDGQLAMRLHTSATSGAEVQMRSTKVDPSMGGSATKKYTSFWRDTEAPLFKAVQSPGDRILFLSIGGFVNGRLITSAEHLFTTRGSGRRINILQINFKPMS